MRNEATLFKTLQSSEPCCYLSSTSPRLNQYKTVWNARAHFYHTLKYCDVVQDRWMGEKTDHSVQNVKEIAVYTVM